MSLRGRLLTPAMVLLLGAAGVVVPTAASAAVAPAAQAQFVRNGSFERPVLADGGFAFRRTIVGWQTAPPSGPIEIDRGALGPAAAGQQYIELDSTKSSTVTQTVTVPTTSHVYGLQLSAAGRPGLGSDDNSFTVLYPGGSVSAGYDAVGQSAPVWHTSALLTFVPTSTTFNVSFVSDGPSNGLGALIDAVSIVRVR